MAIILLLLAMFLPGLNGAREQARKMFCANNLRNWGKAVQMYRLDYGEYVPSEGTTGAHGHKQPMTWYNTLPQYLHIPAYKDFEGVSEAIKERPALHVWICPTKNMTKAYKSESGMNQFHYAMNAVLDGMGEGRPSRDTPGFQDQGSDPICARLFDHKPTTVFMFEIAWNSPRGSPRDVATKYQTDFQSGARIAQFHGDYANILYLDGAVTYCSTDDLVTDKDFRRGDIVWNHPRMYWGYPPN